MIWRILVSWLVGFAFGATGATEPLRIGHVDSLTGADAPYGKAVDNGIRLAIDEVNAAGGIHGRKLVLYSLDDQGKSSEAMTVATKLITGDKVMALLGESTSSKALAIAPLAQQYKIPMISPWATNVKVTQVGDYVFRVCYIDSFQGAMLAKFVSEKLKLKRVAILRDLGSDASIGLSNFFTQAFAKSGGKIVSDQSYTTGDLEFRPQLVAIKEANPEAIFLSGYYAEVGLIARQARELGLKVPFFGGDAWDSPALLPLAGKALEGSYFSDHFSAENQAPEVRGFIERYRKRFGETPSAPAALGYDAANLLAAAMKSVKDVSSSAVREAIARTKDFPGVTGKISINAERNAVKPTVIIQVKDGKFKYFSSVQ